MTPADPVTARPWALLDAVAGPPFATGPGRADPAIFGGVVVLDVAPAGEGRVGALRGGLRDVPDDVATIVYLDEAPGEATGAVVTELVARLRDGDDAVVAAVPVTDALKRVEGERVVSSADRRGLYGVRTPQVLRRPVFDAVLAAAPAVPAGPVDPAVLLLAAGRRVRVVPVDPTGDAPTDDAPTGDAPAGEASGR